MTKPRKVKTPTRAMMVVAAKDSFHDEGTCEIDDGAKVSRATDNPEKGAYVQAWVWVRDEDAFRLACKECPHSVDEHYRVGNEVKGCRAARCKCKQFVSQFREEDEEEEEEEGGSE